MMLFIATTIVMLLAVLGLGLGVLLAGRPPVRSCGNAAGAACSGCTRPCRKEAAR